MLLCKTPERPRNSPLTSPYPGPSACPPTTRPRLLTSTLENAHRRTVPEVSCELGACQARQMPGSRGVHERTERDSKTLSREPYDQMPSANLSTGASALHQDKLWAPFGKQIKSSDVIALRHKRLQD